MTYRPGQDTADRNFGPISIIVPNTGLSQPFLGMGPGPLELGKIASFRLKLGKKYNVLYGGIFLPRDS